MTEPDPDFVKWFSGDWQRRLEATVVPGMADASWDRKAAWLLWCAEDRAAHKASLRSPDRSDAIALTGGLFD